MENVSSQIGIPAGIKGWDYGQEIGRGEAWGFPAEDYLEEIANDPQQELIDSGLQISIQKMIN